MRFPAIARPSRSLADVGTAAGVAAKQVVEGSAATVQDVNVTQVGAEVNQTLDSCKLIVFCSTTLPTAPCSLCIRCR